uniref:Uncharacterized protein n=1 Tax=Prochlorococcus marinus str. P0902-H212 TaxID=1620696 RepID=A0A0D5A2H3_PROMR|nr:hypothetical protein FA02_0449 [Prochlorococcus marinus str. P0902-H212]
MDIRESFTKVNVIFSFSDVSINILTKSAIQIKDLSLSIPIYQPEAR